MNKRLHLIVKGRVQGVFYRQFVMSQASELSLKGWVRNLEDGNVEIMAEGERQKLDKMILKCHEGPSGARVDNLYPEWFPAKGDLSSFTVIHS